MLLDRVQLSFAQFGRIESGGRCARPAAGNEKLGKLEPLIRGIQAESCGESFKTSRMSQRMYSVQLNLVLRVRVAPSNIRGLTTFLLGSSSLGRTQVDCHGVNRSRQSLTRPTKTPDALSG